MAVCPNCGNAVDKPLREIENVVFYAAIFVCPKCGCEFKVQRYRDSWLKKK